MGCSKSSSESSRAAPAVSPAKSTAITSPETTTKSQLQTSIDTDTGSDTQTKTATGDPSVIQFSKHLGTRSHYLTARLNEVGGPLPGAAIANTIWQCPENSVVTGMKASYLNLDRKFQIECGFLEDGMQRPIVRQNCQTSSTTTGLVDFMLSPACPLGTFPAGLQSSKIAADRSFSFYCCELATADGVKLAIPTIDAGNGLGLQPACDPSMAGMQAQLWGLVPNLQVNASGQASFAFSCPVDAAQKETNKVVTGFYGEYFRTEQDRRWGFDCCQLALPVPASN